MSEHISSKLEKTKIELSKCCRLIQSGVLLVTMILFAAAIDLGHKTGRAEANDSEMIVIPIPEQVPATEGMVKLPDVSLYYWDSGGTGTPIILMHPLTGSGKVWSYQQPFFAKAGYRVIGYSRRGFNGSETGPEDNPGTASGDLLNLIDALGIEKFHAVATAGGAFVAADFAISHPERLQSLVLACSTLRARGDEISQMTSGLRPKDVTLPEYFMELSPSYRAANPQGTELWKHNEKNSRSSVGGTRQGFANTITLDGLRQFTFPTLVIAGGADLIAPPPVMRVFANHIPNSEMVVINEAGHSAYWERPDVFNQVVLTFICKHEN